MIKPVAVIASEIQRGITEAREKRQEMDDLSPRELDARVAVDVMGWTLDCAGTDPITTHWKSADEKLGILVMSWSPSSDWSCMKLVVERMHHLGWCLGMIEYDDARWQVTAYELHGKKRSFNVVADTLPRVVSLAALKAVAK